MRLLLHVPLPRGSTRGNWITALRWTRILLDLGHTVRAVDPSEFDSVVTSSYDALIALHARRSAEQIKRFRITAPRGKIIVALTGTDLHIDLKSESHDSCPVTDSINIADRLVLLEPEGLKKLKPGLRRKCNVIYQSSTLPILKGQIRQADFRISLLAHLREVKDPYLIIRALELLPPSSNVQVTHAGEATNAFWRTRAMNWNETCSRYDWIGAIPRHDAIQLLANSQVTVLTSHHEGAPSVFSEASALGIPILSTRITAAVGILGAEHPGLFSRGNAVELAKLIHRVESDHAFYVALCRASVGLRNRLSPEAERLAWKTLLDNIGEA